MKDAESFPVFTEHIEEIVRDHLRSIGNKWLVKIYPVDT